MQAMIIRRRTLMLILLGVCGILLLVIGLKGGLLEQRNQEWDIPVSQPGLPGDVSIEEVPPPSLPVDDTGKMDLAVIDDSADFFVEYRLERDRTRGQRVEWLREVINNEQSAVETRQKAQESLLAISNKMETETELESLLKAKGFKDVAVIADEQAVTVIVTSEVLSAGECSEISNLVSRKTGVDAKNIAIIARI